MLFLTTVCLLVLSGYALGACSDGCSEPTLFYDALNCKPVFASQDACCPSEYDCSHIEEKGRANEEKCYFHGKTYNSGDQIDDADIYGNCEVGCGCKKLLRSGNMGFACAILDCPEWLGARPKPGCNFKYELDKCCTVGEVCPPYKATCEVNGKKYHEGDQFDAPDVKCTKCVCQEGFEGKFEAPFCKKRTCIDEARRQKEVYSFCAPSYHLGDCCPVYWICPEEDDKIVAAATVKNSNLKCKFGDKTLNIGDKFERTSGDIGKVSCECRIPPYLTCVQ